MTGRPALSTRSIVAVYVALMLLLAATWSLSFVDLGGMNTPVSLGISMVKALLVMLFFMELKYDSWLIDLAASVGFYWLSILMTLVLADYLTRAL